MLSCNKGPSLGLHSHRAWILVNLVVLGRGALLPYTFPNRLPAGPVHSAGRQQSMETNWAARGTLRLGLGQKGIEYSLSLYWKNL